MTSAAARFVTEQVPIAGTKLHLLKGGAGPPCLVLHGIEGHEGWLTFHARLSESATVYAPSHPGYGHTDCPAWISSVWHQAVFYNWFLQSAQLRDVTLVGTGVGGWIAASMAVMCEAPLRRLVLVDAAGINPQSNEIFDVFVARWREVIDRGFFDAANSPEYQRIYSANPLVEFGGIREAGRVMSMKMCFKPYMYDPALAAMLRKITVPTLIVWGDSDRIIPLECAHAYQEAIAHARLETLPQCGHFAHLDKPAELAALIRQ